MVMALTGGNGTEGNRVCRREALVEGWVQAALRLPWAAEDSRLDRHIEVPQGKEVAERKGVDPGGRAVGNWVTRGESQRVWC